MVTLRLAFLVATIATSVSFVVAQGVEFNPPGPMGFFYVRNTFRTQQLFVQCSTDTGVHRVTIVPPLVRHVEVFFPDANAYMLCTVYTGGRPVHEGKFNLYVRDPASRFCYKDCSWRADEDGLTLTDTDAAGFANHIHYDWQRKD